MFNVNFYYSIRRWNLFGHVLHFPPPPPPVPKETICGERGSPQIQNLFFIQRTKTELIKENYINLFRRATWLHPSEQKVCIGETN